MPGRSLWYLLLLITAHLWSTVSKSPCKKEKKKLASQECSNYSCRDKCNMTGPVLRSNGIQQVCYCDEKCVTFQDCCEDFASNCPQLLQGQTKEYPQFFTSCHSNVLLILGVQAPSRTNLLSTDSTTSTTVSTSAEFGVELFEPFDIPGWLVELRTMSQMRIDHTHGLAFVKDFHVKSESEQGTHFTYTPLPFITASLQASEHFTHIEYLTSKLTILVRSVEIPNGHSFIRECWPADYYRCPHCDRLISESLCSEYATKNPSNASPETNTEIDACTKQSSDGTGQDTERRPIQVIVIPTENPERINVVSYDLPWSNIQCDTRSNRQDCEIQSCAVDRILSPDGNACFIPTRISVLVVKRDEMESATYVPSKKFDETSTKWTPFSSQLGFENRINDPKPASKRNVKVDKIPAPIRFCIALHRLLHTHTLWTLHGIFLRQECMYKLKFNSTAKDHERNDPVNNSKLSGHQELDARIRDNSLTGKNSKENNSATKEIDKNNRTSISGARKTRRFAASANDNGIPSSGNIDMIKVENSNNMPTTGEEHKDTEAHPDPTISTDNDPAGVAQAWNLIHQNLDKLPETQGLLSVELCLESKLKQPCGEDNDQISCRDRMSRCFSYSLAQTTAAAAHTHASVMIYVSWWWLLMTVHLC